LTTLSRYDFDTLLEIGGELVRELAHGKQHRSKRPHNKRRRTPKMCQPGCGIAGRRNHRWHS
jgi:hypothetical protein